MQIGVFILMETAKISKKDEDLALWKTWKENPSPSTLRPLLDNLNPLIYKETSRWDPSGINKTRLHHHATSLAFNALHTYDPSKGTQLNTHIINNLQKMSRYAINNQQAIRTPEEKIFNYRKMLKIKESLEERLGREPSEMELQDAVGSGFKIKDYKPLIEHYYSKAAESGGNPVMQELSLDSTALALLHENLSPMEKTVFEHSFGYKGAPILQNQEIAKKIKISPAAVSKTKSLIEKKYRDYSSAVSYIS